MDHKDLVLKPSFPNSSQFSKPSTPEDFPCENISWAGQEIRKVNWKPSPLPPLLQTQFHNPIRISVIDHIPFPLPTSPVDSTDLILLIFFRTSLLAHRSLLPGKQDCKYQFPMPKKHLTWNPSGYNYQVKKNSYQAIQRHPTLQKSVEETEIKEQTANQQRKIHKSTSVHIIIPIYRA